MQQINTEKNIYKQQDLFHPKLFFSSTISFSSTSLKSEHNKAHLLSPSHLACFSGRNSRVVARFSDVFRYFLRKERCPDLFLAVCLAI